MSKNFSGSIWGEYPPVKKNTPIPIISYKQAVEDLVEHINNTPFDKGDIETLYSHLLAKRIKIKEDTHE